MDKAKRENKTIARFWERVARSGDDACWIWQGACNTNGYGILSVNLKTTLAHRFSWGLHYGEIPAGEGYHGTCVMHKCDNKLCVNPNHLSLGTQGDNMKDMVSKKRANYGARKKLSTEAATEIKQILASKGRASLRRLAKEYGVSHNALWQIAHGIAWKDA